MTTKTTDLEQQATNIRAEMTAAGHGIEQVSAPTRLWTVATDAVTATVEAADEDDAARRFAAPEKIGDIDDAFDLRTWAEGRGGWCRIIDGATPEAIFDAGVAATNLGPRGGEPLDKYAESPGDDEPTRAHYREAVAAARRGDFAACRDALVDAARSAGL